MAERSIARVSLVLSLALVTALFGAWSAAGSPAQESTDVMTAAPEDATCIDVDPETGAGPSYGEHQLNAVVTNGVKSTTGSDDSCSGAPVQGVQVAWVVEDDAPDAWYSSQDGVPTTKTVTGGNADPNAVTTQTKADGTTFVRVQLNDPTANGDNRFSAHFGSDVPEPGSNTVCDLPEPLGYPCPGEDDNEDDVTFTWFTATPTPTPTAPTKAERQVSLSAPASMKSSEPAAFSGRVTSADQACASGQFVQIQRRAAGQIEFGEFDSTTTDSAGNYAVTRVIDFNAEYRAIVGENETCAEAISPSQTVLAAAAITASATPANPGRGTRFTLTGAVRPQKPGTTVQLQRNQDGAWRLVRRAELGAESVFRFRLRARFNKGVFRIRWVSQDELNETGIRRIEVKTRR